MDAETEKSHADENGGPWLPIAELARLKGVERQTVHEKVNRFERDGLLATRPGKGKTRLVDVAAYDLAARESTDFSRQQSAATRAANDSGEGGPAPDMRWTDAQRQKMEYEARIKALDYGERSKQLVSIAGVKNDIEKIFNGCIGSLDSLASRAEEVTAAAIKDGIPGARRVLADAVFKIRATIGAAMRELETAGRSQDAAGVEVALDDTESELPL